MSTDLLVGPGIVATPREVLSGAGVRIQAGRISAVDDFSTLVQRASRETSRLDTRGGMILPGLINAHTHLYSALACGIGLKDEAPTSFPETLERLWWRLDRALTSAEVETSALLGLAECVHNGVTTVIDHHASPRAREGSLDLLRRAAETMGVRTALCYEVSDRNGVAGAQAGIEENRRFIRALAADPSELVTAMFGVHALFTVSEETLECCVATAHESGVGLHLHVAEDRVDVEHNLTRHGARPVVRLARHGALDERSIAAHCVHVDAAEIDLLASSKALVVHNPESNMNNAVGCAPVPEMMARGVRVGLGTDGMSADMLGTARAGFLLHRHHRGDPRIGWAEMPVLLWRENARFASALFGRDLGVLAPGAAGDLVVLDYDPATPLDSKNLFAHLVFGFAARHVTSVVVGGSVIMRERELQGVDEQDLRARGREQAEKLWQRF